MEHFGAIFDGEMCSEEAEFMAQLLGNCSVPTHESNKNVVRVLDASEMYSFPFSSHDQSYLSSGSSNLFDDLMTMDYSMMEDTKDHTCLDHDHMMLNQDVSNAKRSRVPNYEVQRIKSNKRLKVDETNDDDNNNNNNNKTVVRGRKTNSSCCSEDDSNTSHELNGVTSSSTSKVNESKKSRANRGSATDPQSLYARKRREKINARLRILQKLVPNGTKVDISTMLEEAVEYVKFLQVQIKLLSSDDMWMYAPIAYNGMGLDLTKSLS